jgi:hypothetical protein
MRLSDKAQRASEIAAKALDLPFVIDDAELLNKVATLSQSDWVPGAVQTTNPAIRSKLEYSARKWIFLYCLHYKAMRVDSARSSVNRLQVFALAC